VLEARWQRDRLALDLFVFPDGEALLLDEDEFNALNWNTLILRRGGKS